MATSNIGSTFLNSLNIGGLFRNQRAINNQQQNLSQLDQQQIQDLNSAQLAQQVALVEPYIGVKDGRAVIDISTATDATELAKISKAFKGTSIIGPGADGTPETMGFHSVVPDPNREGAFVIQVTNPNGDVVPITDNRTSDPEDPVTPFSIEDLSKTLTAQFQMNIGRVGEDIPQSLFMLMAKSRSPSLGTLNMSSDPNTTISETAREGKKREYLKEQLTKFEIENVEGDASLSDKEKAETHQRYINLVGLLDSGRYDSKNLDKLGASLFGGDLKAFNKAIDAIGTDSPINAPFENKEPAETETETGPLAEYLGSRSDELAGSDANYFRKSGERGAVKKYLKNFPEFIEAGGDPNKFVNYFTEEFMGSKAGGVKTDIFKDIFKAAQGDATQLVKIQNALEELSTKDAEVVRQGAVDVTRPNKISPEQLAAVVSTTFKDYQQVANITGPYIKEMSSDEVTSLYSDILSSEENKKTVTDNARKIMQDNQLKSIEEAKRLDTEQRLLAALGIATYAAKPGSANWKNIYQAVAGIQGAPDVFTSTTPSSNDIRAGQNVSFTALNNIVTSLDEVNKAISAAQDTGNYNQNKRPVLNALANAEREININRTRLLENKTATLRQYRDLARLEKDFLEQKLRNQFASDTGGILEKLKELFKAPADLTALSAIDQITVNVEDNGTVNDDTVIRFNNSKAEVKFGELKNREGYKAASDIMDTLIRLKQMEAISKNTGNLANVKQIYSESE